ncbi:CDP-paratose 2-epimerase [Aureimonas sp. Leaf454]|uniref:SDR family NAD(P)-dependent oxidoreductase n=1 Tax=Aureimonas sp. Leaf454 TaxID=1736381 RepID=UPI0006FE3B5B|nr:SDR family NAD(P)-dependent oxidoreductase [Aureimonas sp. Leaf454]KQT53772.1 CDP-paratose 2-epimerase [Aureimonas sp. Leaf454]
MRPNRERVVVTGGAGFIGSNLANRLAEEGHEVVIFDTLARPGVERNRDWLVHRHGARVVPIAGDVRDAAALDAASASASVIFHLAAQVAVTTSLVDPAEDFAINLAGTFNVLETARRRSLPVIFASTNKVYGDLSDISLELVEGAWKPADPALRSQGVGEGRPLDFHTPYGCSKGAGDQYVLDYARSYGLATAVLRMSCVYGQRQMGTEDQGWVAHFLIRAMEGRPITLYGDGRQVRDILYVDDAVDAYVAAWRNIASIRGRAFNLGGGPANAVSLRDLLAHLETLVGHAIDVRFEDWRQGDQKYFVADASGIRSALSLGEPLAWREGVARLADWLRMERGHRPSQRTAAA